MSRQRRHLRLALAVGLAAGLAGCGSETPSPSASGPAAESQPQSPAADAETVVLRPIFTAGDRFTLEHEELSRTTQSSSLYSLAREAYERRVFEIEILEAEPAGVARLRFSMRRIESRLVDNGVPSFVYDSDAESNPGSPPGRARDLLAGLVAEARVGPEGTVLSMSANITRDEVASLPEGLRPLLAENWFRSVIETIYRPMGEPRPLPIGEPQVQSGPATAPLPTDRGRIVETTTVLKGEEGRYIARAESVLELDGRPDPSAYAALTEHVWDAEAGRTARSTRREQAAVERKIAGVAGLETIERRILVGPVNPSAGIDDNDSSGG